MPKDAPSVDDMSQGEILATQDGLDEEDILRMFGPFYMMKVQREAMKGLEGLRGKTFKLAFGRRVAEIAEQYGPYEFYGSLKEGTVPIFEVSDLVESFQKEIERMERANQKRMDKGKKLKFSVRTIDTFEEALREILERDK